MSKKKPVDLPPPQPSYRYPKFSPQFLDDLAWWYKNARRKIDKIFGLVTDTILHPFEVTGTRDRRARTNIGNSIFF